MGVSEQVETLSVVMYDCVESLHSDGSIFLARWQDVGRPEGDN